MMKCKCGHDISDHDTGYGCLADTDDRHVCKCNNEKDVIYQDYIAALLAAGNEMAERLRAINEYVTASATEDASVKLYAPNNAAALTIWEEVTK
jgi:hypothetical protein